MSQRISDTLAHLLDELPLSHITAGQTIFRQGQHCENYFVLEAGSARIFARSSNGKEVLLYHVKPGDVCILTTACLLSGKHFPAEAIAETDMRLRVISKALFDQLLESNRDFRQQVFASFSERINSLISTIEKLALESIEQRLAKYLLLQPHTRLANTHEAIALEIGTAREVVSRHLKKFENQRWVKLGRGSVDILDREGLYRLL